MSYKTFKWARILMAMFLAATVSIAVSINNIYLALSSVIIGIISMFLIKRNVKEVLVDEMVKSIAGKAALMTYSITVPVLAVLSLILIFSDLKQKSLMYDLGTILSYIVLFNMFVYSFFYYHYQRKYGRSDE
jgi:uncharacterized membrane protein